MNKDIDLFDSIRRISQAKSDRSRLEADIRNKHGTQCAMLVLDSTGFTRSTQESGIFKYLECIVRMRDILRPLFSGSECISWRFTTDNAYAEFQTPEDALKAAIAIQKSVREANVMIDDKTRFGVCIGIGFGEVLRSNHEGVFGNEMNLASKLGEDLAGYGEILITESVFNSIPEEYRKDTSRKSATISGIDLSYYIVSK